MTSDEVREIQGQIAKTCEDIIKKTATGAFNDESGSLSPLMRRTISYNADFSLSARKTSEFPKQSHGLSNLQKRELDHFDEIDYMQYPVHPCVRSLYYLSKIAQNQQIKIIVPPTILLGFGDDNRIIYNDEGTGVLVVKSGYISPKIINNFINKYMVKQHLNQSIQQRLQFPKFVIRFGQKSSQKNEIKVYYSKDSLIADLMNYWGSVDMAIQIFVKQKHLRPYIYRYYMKNGNVYKAIAICNQENMNKDSRLYQTILNLIKEWHHKQIQAKQKAEANRPKSGGTERKRSQIKKNLQEQIGNLMSIKKPLSDLVLPGQEDISLDSKGFPNSLEAFKINEFYLELQTLFSNTEFKKYFTCTSDWVENLAMMNCRPGVSAQAEKMTLDLYRLFGQYYLKSRKYGQISQFVCDFIEGENGLVQLLQVKAFECEGLLHDWQAPWSPTKTSLNTLRDSENECKAQIICNNEELNEIFVETCKVSEQWLFSRKKPHKVGQRVIDRYFKEIQIGKENFLLQSEKSKICPLYPLTTFFEGIKTPAYNSKSPKQIQIKHMELNNDEKIHENNNIFLRKQKKIDFDDVEVICCQSCFKVLELYSERYCALVFKTEQTIEELRKLKLKMVNQWSKDNFIFLLKLYKQSKRSLGVLSEIEKQNKRALKKSILERAKTPDSVVDKSIKHFRDKDLALLMINQQQQKSCTNFNNSQTDLNTTPLFNKTKGSFQNLDICKNLVGEERLLISEPLTSRATKCNSAMSRRIRSDKQSSYKQQNSFSKKVSIDDRSPIQDIRKTYQILPLALQQQVNSKTPRELIKNFNAKELKEVVFKYNLKLQAEQSQEGTELVTSRNINQQQQNINGGQGGKIPMPSIGTTFKAYMNSQRAQGTSVVKESLFLNRKHITRVQDINDYFNNKRLQVKESKQPNFPTNDENQVNVKKKQPQQQDLIDMVIV